MKRRAFIGALAAGVPALAGCVGGPGTEPGRTDDTATGTDTPSGSPADTPGGDPGSRWTTIVDLETAPRTYALTPTQYRDGWIAVEVGFTSTATADSPATVRATLTNESDYDDTVPLDWLPPFGRPFSTHPRDPGSQSRHGREYTYRAGLLFAPAADNPLVESPPAVERDADGQWRAADTADWTPDPVELAPGESVTGDYHLVGHPDGAGQGRPTGIYGFTRDEDPSLTVAVWDSERPGPDTDSRFAGVSLPPLPGDGTTGWYHESDPSAPSYVEPETERTGLPAAVPFTFVNHSRKATGCGHWRFYKLVDGEWFELGPRVHTADCRMLPPGGSKRVRLRAFHAEGLDGGSCGGRSFAFEHLGGGRYAAVAGYGAETDRSAALVEFDAPPVEVTPTDDLSVDRGDGAVTVTADRHGDETDDATLVVERADGADRRLVAEQVMQRRDLRNTLPFFESGIDRVELRTDDAVARRASGFGSGPLRFRYAGEAFRIAASDR
ncbi:MAG: hypothetical protein V5A23_03135 [Halobacteriales archaeon]